MVAVTTPLTDRASSIFADLGYSVSRTGNELRAERKWRVVHVTCDRSPNIPMDGTHRCFVTPAAAASRTYRRLASADPDYDWAVVGLDSDDEYEVYRPSD